MAFFPTRVVNQVGLGTFDEVLFELIDDMVALGWRVFGSGDGLALFSNEGQTAGGEDAGNPWGTWSVIRGFGAGANNLGNATFNVGSAWLRLRTPSDALVQREYLFTLDFRTGLSLNDWRLQTTRDPAGFDTGATANTAPTGIDAIALAGYQILQASSADFRTWIPSGAGNPHSWILGDKDDEYSFIYMNIRSSDDGVWGVWGLDQVVPVFPGSNPPATEDPDPHYHLISHASSSGNSFDWADRVSSGRSDLSALSGIKIENYAGTQGPERGLIASMFFGEPGPPADAGHYQVAFGHHAEGDLTSDLADIGVMPAVGKGLSVNGIPIMKAAVAPRFQKGFARGRLIRGSSFGSSVPDTLVDASLALEQQTRARFGDMGISIPWPNGVGIVL